jgi:uncharacterized protein (DUF1015 family)
MARVDPFAGIRYDTGQVALGDVVAPPYDVVDEAERAELAALSPYNSIHVELPVPAGDLDRYENAARLFADWRAAGVLNEEVSEAVYVYRMSFGGGMTTGIVASLGLGEDVLPHEETMPKPRGDRLDLLRATRINTSPIWGLSSGRGLGKLASAAVEGREPVAAEADGVSHELWALTDESLVAEICGVAGDGPILLADGHHRYETARAYAAESNAPGADAVMAYIAELAEDELHVEAINRLVTGLPPGFDIAAALGEFFEVTESQHSGFFGVTEGEHLDGIVLVTASGSFLLRASPETDAGAGAALDSSRLAVALASLPEHEVTYQHGRDPLLAAVGAGTAQAAFFLRPPAVDQIAEVARGGRRMPPKTTFFYPKPRTGMVFRSVS